MKNRIIITLAVVACFASCSPLYIPTVAQTPLFQEKGELQLGGYGGSSGFDYQSSYSFHKNFAAMVNGSYIDRADSNSAHRHFFIESGVGYFHKLDRKGVFELFAGYGTGNNISDYDNLIFIRENVRSTNARLFIQPSIGTRTENFEISGTSRFVFVTARSDNFATKRASFFEPIMTCKAGNHFIKLVGQSGLAIPLNKNFAARNFEYRSLMLSIGFVAQLNVKKLKKTEDV